MKSLQLFFLCALYICAWQTPNLLQRRIFFISDLVDLKLLYPSCGKIVREEAMKGTIPVCFFYLFFLFLGFAAVKRIFFLLVGLFEGNYNEEKVV